MNARLAASALGAAALGAVAWVAARAIPGLTAYASIAVLAGVLLGFILTPLMLRSSIRRLEAFLRDAPIGDILVTLLGLGLGLLIAVLVAIPLVLLGSPVGNVLPAVVAVVAGVAGARVALSRRVDLRTVFTSGTGRPALVAPAVAETRQPQVLLDTSAIIDGRIADVSATGFISGQIIVPRFVLEELQHIADSPDVLRRNRGRRGLDMLNRMRKEAEAEIKILDIDPPETRDVHEVDAKLVQIARSLRAPIITNDYNLNKVAQLQGVRVLNLNELANAVKPVVLPNEEMVVKIIQAGKEPGQGVGYLDDGTMIVVEDGARYIEQDVDIVVTRVLQTVAGRMIFAALKGQNARGAYNVVRGR